MNNEQIKEVMRLADEIADYAWKEGISDGAYSMEGGIVSKDIETMKPVIAGAVGNPARTCAGSCEGNAYQIEIRRLTAERDAMAAELAALAKRKPAAVIATAGSTGGCVEWTGGIRLAVGSKLYIRPIPADPVNAELLEALKDARHCIGIDRDTLVDCHTNPCTGYRERHEGAVAKVSPCAGHAVQQDADDLVGLRGCNSRHGGMWALYPCIYRMRTTDPGCTGCVWRGEDQPAEAGHEND